MNSFYGADTEALRDDAGRVLMETDGQEDAAVQRVGRLSRDSVHALVEELVVATGPDSAR